MHDHDVWNDRCQWSADDRKMWLHAEKYYDRCIIVSLSVGIGFTQVPELFAIFPEMVQNVFGQNCVAVVFLVSIILNLVLPQNMEATIQEKA